MSNQATIEQDQYNFKIKKLGFTSTQHYQEFHSLKQDNILETITKRSLDRVRFCSCPDIISPAARLTGFLRQWPSSTTILKVYSAQSSFPNFPKKTTTLVLDTLVAALKEWLKYTNINATSTQYENEANIIISSGRIDGPSGTLAWSELPNVSSDNQQPVNQKYDSSEPWVYSSNPPPSTIDLYAVMCHELGHALGMSHLPQDSGGLMAPFYKPGLRIPQPIDIVQLHKRHANKTTPPLPPITPPTTPDSKIKLDISISINGVEYGLHKKFQQDNQYSVPHIPS